MQKKMKILVAIPFKKNINGLRITLNSLLDGSTFDGCGTVSNATRTLTLKLLLRSLVK